MNDNRQETTDLAREQYSTPTYTCFAFETSGLIQTSGPQLGSVSYFGADAGNANSAFSGGETPW